MIYSIYYPRFVQNQFRFDGWYFGGADTHKRVFHGKVVVVVVVLVDRFYTVLFSTLGQTHCAHMGFQMSG